MKPKITNEQILAELKAGISQRKIAEKYGMHYMAIYQRIARMRANGIEVPDVPFRADVGRKKTRQVQNSSGRCVERCGKSDCKYIAYLSGMLICDYIIMTGHSRGCPPEYCTKYEKI